MEESDSSEVTRLLQAAGAGNREAVDQLLPLVYDELRQIARGQFRSERASHTLHPTALVHEAYLKLVGQASIGFADRSQFFGVAAQAMRRILIDYARQRKRLKRGEGRVPIPIEEALAVIEETTGDIEQIDEALTALAAHDEVRAKLVELRFFGGLSMKEAAEALSLPQRSAERAWNLARAFLKTHMTGPAEA